MLHLYSSFLTEVFIQLYRIFGAKSSFQYTKQHKWQLYSLLMCLLYKASELFISTDPLATAEVPPGVNHWYLALSSIRLWLHTQYLFGSICCFFFILGFVAKDKKIYIIWSNVSLKIDSKFKTLSKKVLLLCLSKGSPFFQPVEWRLFMTWQYKPI